MWVLSHFSHVRLFGTPWTVACQTPLSTEFFRQEYWSGLPYPTPEHLPNPGIEPESAALQADSLPLHHWDTFPLPTLLLMKLKTVWHQWFLIKEQSNFKVKPHKQCNSPLLILAVKVHAPQVVPGQFDGVCFTEFYHTSSIQYTFREPSAPEMVSFA